MKTRAVASDATTAASSPVPSTQARDGGEVAGVGRAVVVLEVVDLGVVAGEAAARPGLAGGVGRAAGACQRRGDVAGKVAAERGRA